MKSNVSKGQTDMDKLTEGYEEFIKGKGVNKNGKKVFNNALKKAATTKKPRATK